MRTNTRLRDMNVCVSARDQRSIEVLPSGFPLHHEAQLAVHARVRPTRMEPFSPLHAPIRSGSTTNFWRVIGPTSLLSRWKQRKIGVHFQFGRSESSEAPSQLRRSAFHVWRRHWTRMLAMSCGRAFSSSLVSSRSERAAGQRGHPPDLADLFGTE